MTERSSSELRAASYATIFGLLAATGMRLSEVIGLQREDVDLKQGVLTIRESKFYASRYVPLHPSTVHALKCYIALSTYVGQATASGTYWYLTATPRLMALAAGRFARRNSGGYR